MSAAVMRASAPRLTSAVGLLAMELPTHGALSQFGLVGTAQHRLRTHYRSRTVTR